MVYFTVNYVREKKRERDQKKKKKSQGKIISLKNLLKLINKR